MSLSLRTLPRNVVTLEESPAYAFMEEFGALCDIADPQIARARGVNLFHRWTAWIEGNAENDPMGYNASTTTIFSLILELSEKGILAPNEKVGMYKRAFTVVKNPSNDPDLNDFIKARMKELNSLG